MIRLYKRISDIGLSLIIINEPLPHFEVLSVLEHSSVTVLFLKSISKGEGWRKIEIFKFYLTSTPKRCWTYWVYRNNYILQKFITNYNIK